MSAGGNGTSVSAGACARHDAEMDQLADDVRTYTRHYHELDERVDRHDRDFGAITTELAAIQRAVGTVVDSVTAMHEEIRRLVRPRMPSIADEFGETTKTNLRVGDTDALAHQLADARVEIAALKADQSARRSERVQRVDAWRVWVPVLVGVLGAVSAVLSQVLR